MDEQFELFQNPKRAAEKKPKQPPLTRHERLEMTFARKLIISIKKEHDCARCEGKIPAGFSAMEIIPIERGRKQSEKVEYYHLKKDCPEWNQ